MKKVKVKRLDGTTENGVQYADGSVKTDSGDVVKYASSFDNLATLNKEIKAIKNGPIANIEEIVKSVWSALQSDPKDAKALSKLKGVKTYITDIQKRTKKISSLV